MIQSGRMQRRCQRHYARLRCSSLYRAVRPPTHAQRPLLSTPFSLASRGRGVAAAAAPIDRLQDQGARSGGHEGAVLGQLVTGRDQLPSAVPGLGAAEVVPAVADQRHPSLVVAAGAAVKGGVPRGAEGRPSRPIRCGRRVRRLVARQRWRRGGRAGLRRLLLAVADDQPLRGPRPPSASA